MATSKLVTPTLRQELRDKVAKLKSATAIYQWAVKHPSSELHGFLVARGAFDEKTAQREYGISLIRDLIVRVTISIPQGDDKPMLRVREFASLDSDRLNGGGYRNMREILKDDALTEELVRTYLREARALNDRYETIQAVVTVREIFLAVQAAEGRIKSGQDASSRV